MVRQPNFDKTDSRPLRIEVLDLENVMTPLKPLKMRLAPRVRFAMEGNDEK